jgi:hypothetical protein
MIREIRELIFASNGRPISRSRQIRGLDAVVRIREALSSDLNSDSVLIRPRVNVSD